MMKAPEYNPGELIPPMAYPSSILSQQVVKHVTLDTYQVVVVRFTCAHHARAVIEDEYQVLMVLQAGTILLQHPSTHRAQIVVQASSHMLDERYFFFIESWEERVGGEWLNDYAHHVCVLDMASLTVGIYKDRYDDDVWYKSVDVDPTHQYLLFVLGWEGGFTIQTKQNGSDEWIELNCWDLVGLPLSRVQWGPTINLLRCYHRHDHCYYDLPIDWDQHRILWNPLHATPSD